MSITYSETPLIEPGKLDLTDLWYGFKAPPGAYDLWGEFRQPGTPQEEFLRYLRTLVSDPDAISGVSFCDDCGEPGWEDDEFSSTGNGRAVCESCLDEYSSCMQCEERYPDGDLNLTLSDHSVCDDCLTSYYSYCEDCDGYYHDDDSYEHDHDDDGSGCCTSPQLTFRVRNDGAAPLANDTRADFTLPAGTISQAGIKAIGAYLRRADQVGLSYDLGTLGNQWQTKDGNFAKRLSRHAYKAHQVKLSPEIMSQVGNIASDHSQQVDVRIEVTRDFNQSASYFYHEDSCYWGGYSESRCALKTNGAFGLRSFDSYGGVSGRAWVLPLRSGPDGELVPTFDTETPDAFVVFNGYGDLGGYASARIVAHMAGWTYRKIGFDCSPMYINAGGYLVAPEDIAAPYTDGSLDLDVHQHSSLYESERNLSHAAAA